MAIAITTFTGNASSIIILLTSDTALVTANLLDADGVVTDVLSNFASTATPNEYEATITGDYSDGVFTLDCTNSVDALIVSIGNLKLGSQYLLYLTINDQSDSLLLQQLEGIRQLLLANEGDLARDIYIDVQRKSAFCTGSDYIEIAVEKTSVWIVAAEYVIV